MNRIAYLATIFITGMLLSFGGALDICTANNCKNGSMCVLLANGDYKCQCLDGYKGTYCEELTDQCRLHQCENGATCVDLGHEYRCQCLNGWYGQYCQINVDDCAQKPCKNGGVCKDLENHKYLCECPQNFIGMHCELPDPCSEANPCGVNGKCISDNTGNYKCHCNKGFIGPACSIDIDECIQYDTELCENGGKCINTIGSYRCECAKGYSGERCTNDIIDCKNGTCLNGGTCLDKIGHYRCVCTEKFRGKNCEVPVPICETIPCKNNGQCRPNGEDFHCSCPKQWTGKTCDTALDPCSDNSCANEGICQSDGFDKVKCFCKPGFSGRLCESNVDDCLGIKCQNRGVCEDLVDAWRCKCAPGFAGRYCEINVDECHSRPCQNNGVCVDQINGYRCECTSGWTGRDCGVNVDECVGQPCFNGAKCEDKIGGFVCHCLEGFVGTKCESRSDICSQSMPCKNRGVCRNDPSKIEGYVCDCPHGFHDSVCGSETSTCTSLACANGGRCVTFEGKERCSCAPGFSGRLCGYEVDECRNNPCQHGGTCQDLVNDYFCHCPLGYKGKKCEININECVSHPCGSNGLCIDQINGFRCDCFLPYYGETCSSIYEPCVRNSCENDATCVPTNDYKSYTCNCSTAVGQFKGQLCEVDIDECSLGLGEMKSHSLLIPKLQNELSGPCFHGGACINTNGSFICKCSTGFEGRQCEINHDDCAEDPCKNGAGCRDMVDSYECQCAPGFSGVNCETEINECDGAPCQNGAQCFDHVNDYQCVCVLGYSGRNCEVNDDDCTESSCAGHGMCQDKINDFECHCFSGFKGQNCEYEERPCDSNKCLNNGSCINRYSKGSGHGYMCACHRGFSGQFCEIEMDWCRGSPCGDHGVCVRIGRSFECKCSDGYFGERCELRKNETCESFSHQRQFQNQSISSNVCLHDGFCFNHPEIGAFKCSCPGGYRGTFCEDNIDDCANQPCRNDGECIDGIGMYVCKCPPGFQGVNCEINVNDCLSESCQPGKCVDQINNFTCVCPRGTSGRRCNEINDFCKNVKCLNGGKCNSVIGDFNCKCPKGFTGKYCEINVNECRYLLNDHLISPIGQPYGLCSPIGSDRCIDGRGDFKCQCKPFFDGKYCQTRVDTCEEMRRSGKMPCTNGGRCVNHYNKTSLERHSYRCECPEGYGGDRCQLYSERCQGNPCKHGGICRPVDRGYKMSFVCDCVPGVGGLFCEKDYENECHRTVCHNGGLCLDDFGKGTCQCADGFTGEKCEARASEKINLPTVVLMATYKEELRQCQIHNCLSKANNKRCDQECNNFACKFDGDECMHKVPKSVDETTVKLAEPWSNCSIIKTNNIPCQHLFSNGRCDSLCNNEQCLFDGWDCEKPINQCHNKDLCDSYYGDKRCHVECNSIECDFDGGDCLGSNKSTVPGSMVLVLPVSTTDFVRVWQARLLRSLAHLLHSIVRVKRRDSGDPMIYPIRVFVETRADNEVVRQRRSIGAREDPRGKPGTKVYLEIDNGVCRHSNFACFDSSKSAAEFVTAALYSRSYHPPIQILSVQSDNEDLRPIYPSEKIIPNTVTYAIIVIVCFLILGVLAGVLYRIIQKKSKTHNLQTKKAQTWFPDGMKRVKHSPSYYFHKHLGSGPKKRSQNLLNDLNSNSELGTIHNMTKSGTSVSDSVDESGTNSLTSTRATSYEANGNDNFNDASNVSENCMLLSNTDVTSVLGADQPMGVDVNLNNGDSGKPSFEICCFNALVHLLISDTGLGDLSSVDSRDKDTAMGKLFQIVANGQTNREDHDLLSCIRTKDEITNNSLSKIVTMTLPQSGETLLHLASRFNRKEASKFLLEAGCDPNLEDKKGRSCLLTAIDASSVEVANYFIEQRHSPINIHHRCSSETTPLIQAVKGAHFDLINLILRNTPQEEFDLNLTDAYGRTALHWACITNQVGVTRLLLSHGLNRDAQDNEEMTPLFLACKEGCLEICKVLVVSGANMEMKDHLDRLPRDIAKENNFDSIITFLDDYARLAKENQHYMMMPFDQHTYYPNAYMSRSQVTDLTPAYYTNLHSRSHRVYHNQSQEGYHRPESYQNPLSIIRPYNYYNNQASFYTNPNTASLHRRQSLLNPSELGSTDLKHRNCSHQIDGNVVSNVNSSTVVKHVIGCNNVANGYPTSNHYTSSTSGPGITPSPDSESPGHWSASSPSLSPRSKNQPHPMIQNVPLQIPILHDKKSVLHYYPSNITGEGQNNDFYRVQSHYAGNRY